MKKRLRAIQRKMLRMVLGTRRRLTRVVEEGGSSLTSASACSDDEEEAKYELEPWSDFLRRVTHLAEDRAKAEGLQEWLATWRQRQWRWARKAVTTNRRKWSSVAMQWSPPLHASQSASRNQARPKKRWIDDIQGYLSELGISQPWQELAQMRDVWSDLEEGFSTWGLPQSGFHP